MNVDKPWMLKNDKNDTEARDIINKFFKPDFFLKRVMLTLQRKKKLEGMNMISLTSKYL
jgi:hypothetical protein